MFNEINYRLFCLYFWMPKKIMSPKRSSDETRERIRSKGDEESIASSICWIIVGTYISPFPNI